MIKGQTLQVIFKQDFQGQGMLIPVADKHQRKWHHSCSKVTHDFFLFNMRFHTNEPRDTHIAMSNPLIKSLQ